MPSQRFMFFIRLCQNLETISHGRQTQIAIIQHKIYDIRGLRIMLDADLAQLYNVEVKVLNQAVKRNIKRFPPDFMFQLTKEEWEILKSQFVTSSWGGKRKLPYAFTEQGLAMLSGILNSDITIQVNINIMRAFVAVRQMLSSVSKDARLSALEKEVKQIKEYIEDIVEDSNDINEDTRMQLELINEAIAELQADKNLRSKPRTQIGFKAPDDLTE